jgi:transcriptional regulator with XRE-family HTH domain
MPSLGQELKRERELRSISLRDISERTKIGIRHLQALEDDRLDLLPGKFLTRAILKAYAKAIGADEDRILNKFHEESLTREWDSRLAERARPERALSKDRERRPRRTLRWIVFATAAIAAVLACLFFFVLPRGGSSPTQPAETAPQGVQRAKDPALEFPALPPVVGTGLPSPAEPLRLEFEFRQATWMHVAADGVLVLEGTRSAGTRETCEARTEIVLQTGNAGGFRLLINGRPARPLGQPGKVLTDVRIRHDNLSQYIEAGK